MTKPEHLPIVKQAHNKNVEIGPRRTMHYSGDMIEETVNILLKCFDLNINLSRGGSNPHLRKQFYSELLSSD